MILSSALCYIISALLIAAGVFFTLFYFKKTGKRFSLLHSFYGGLAFVVMLVAMFALMLYAFSETSTMYMTAMMPEGVYKITVALLFFTAICLIRYFAVNSAYFSNNKTDKGYSFLVGYGLSGGIAVAVYCVFMLIHVLSCAVSSDFIGIEESMLLFESGARIDVFEPFYAHVFVALIFIVYTGLMLIMSMFMDQHANLPYKKKTTIMMYSMITCCELLVICIVLFASTKISAIAIAVISVIIVALAALALRLLYKYKEELPYSKQFD